MSVPPCDRPDCYMDESHSHDGGALVGRHRRYAVRLGYADTFTELEYGVFVDRGHGFMLLRTERSQAVAEMLAASYGRSEIRVRQVTRTPWGVL